MNNLSGSETGFADMIDVEQTAAIVISALEQKKPGQNWKKLVTDAIAEDREAAAEVLIRLADSNGLDLAVPTHSLPTVQDKPSVIQSDGNSPLGKKLRSIFVQRGGPIADNFKR